MDIDEILTQVPIGEIAQKLGVSDDVARQAVQEGGAALLGGLAKNAETEEGSSAIEAALTKHGDFSGATSLDDVDEADGQKIVSHVFGGNADQVAQTLTADQKTAGIDFGKLLPILAPIVMGLIANGKKGASGGGGLGDLLGGLFGGGAQQGSSAGGGLGDVLGGLGGLFGGGQQGSASGGSSAGGIDIGGLLGGLFGGKK